MDDALYQKIITRSGGWCEAEVFVGDTWIRCPAVATDVHHLLPKSRGGRILDEWGETYHLIHLCREDHQQAHSRSNADDMMIDGSVTWDKINNRPIYRGKEEYLKKTYPSING